MNQRQPVQMEHPDNTVHAEGGQIECIGEGDYRDSLFRFFDCNITTATVGTYL
jgi:hypothetical protein